MLKYGVLVVFLFCQAGCADDPTAPRPDPVVDNGKSDNPNGGTDQCKEACKALLNECGEQDGSLALEDCQEDCDNSLLSDNELECLADLECGEQSDPCLGD